MSRADKKFKVLYIDSSNRTISVRVCSDLEDMQILVGSDIQLALSLKNNDGLYVSELGLLASQNYFFYYKGATTPFAGNGLIVGEGADRLISDFNTVIEDIIGSVKFLSREEILKLTMPKEDFKKCG